MVRGIKIGTVMISVAMAQNLGSVDDSLTTVIWPYAVNAGGVTTDFPTNILGESTVPALPTSIPSISSISSSIITSILPTSYSTSPLSESYTREFTGESTLSTLSISIPLVSLTPSPFSTSSALSTLSTLTEPSSVLSPATVTPVLSSTLNFIDSEPSVSLISPLLSIATSTNDIVTSPLSVASPVSSILSLPSTDSNVIAEPILSSEASHLGSAATLSSEFTTLDIIPKTRYPVSQANGTLTISTYSQKFADSIISINSAAPTIAVNLSVHSTSSLSGNFNFTAASPGGITSILPQASAAGHITLPVTLLTVLLILLL